MKRYSCDFETTTKLDDCRVWSWAWMEIGNISNYVIGTDMDQFMDWAIHSNSLIYFHNLKFDGSFVVNWLLHNGYTWSKKPTSTGEFSTIISNMGEWYSIEIFNGYHKKKKLVTKIHDSKKKLPFSVKKIGKDFKLSVLKGDIDYHKERPIGYQLDDNEKEYLMNDVQIVAEALESQVKQGLTRMTNGSDAINEFVDLTKSVYDKLFPIYSLELNAEIRKAYRGGFTWLNPKYENRMIGEGVVLDVNSLYPSQMYERDMPCGFPIEFKGEYEYDKSYPLYIQKITMEFEIKEGFIPCIQLKNNRFFGKTEYLSSSKGERVELYVTNVDWELIQEHYNVFDVKYEMGWKFRRVRGIFKKYVDKWMMVKNTSKGALKVLAKLMLNSLYGKFATNPNVTGKIPYLKEDGSCGFALGEEEFRDPIFTPVGVFITSWARYTTISTAQKCYDRIIYCDTDSMHLEGSEIPEIIKDLVSPDALGLWKKEGVFKRAKFIRQKTYAEEYYAKYKRNEDGSISIDDDGNEEKEVCEKEEADTLLFDVKCAGMPERIKEHLTFENFDIGFSSYGKLKPKQVYGGVVLIDEKFTIK